MAAQAQSRVIRLKSFEKYNPRKDVKNPSWFRFEHGFFEDPDFYDFSHSDIIAWLYILSIASKKNSSEIVINYSHAERIGRLRRQFLDDAIEKLKDIGVVTEDVTHTSRARNADVTDTNATRRDERDVTRQDETGRTEVSTALEQVQHVGGDEVIRKLLLAIRPEVQKAWLLAYPDPEWIMGEIKKAHAWIQVNPRKAPKNFARFMGSWLSRGWEQYRKTLPSNAVSAESMSISEILAKEELERASNEARRI